MDNIVTITNAKKNTLQFELSIEGLEAKEVSVRFVVETAKGIELGFMCKNSDGEKWEVNIPKLEMLEKTAYPFHIDVIADGYYFEPMKGTINVVGSQQIYASEPKNTTLAPPKPSTPVPAAKKGESTKVGKDIKKKDTSIQKKPSEMKPEEVTKKPTPPGKSEKKKPAKKSVKEETKLNNIDVDGIIEKVKTEAASKTPPEKVESIPASEDKKDKVNVHQIIQEAKESSKEITKEKSKTDSKANFRRVSEEREPIIKSSKEPEHQVEKKELSEQEKRIRAILEASKNEKVKIVRSTVPFRKGDVVVH